MTKVPINGHFSNDEIASKHRTTYSNEGYPAPKYLIPPHPGFQIMQAPNGIRAKSAYGEYYSEDTSDLSIELEQIAKWEPFLEKTSSRYVTQGRKKLKFHYKKAVALVDPKETALGWNRWSDNILELFISNRLHKVVWGSGNCGKSRIMAILLYIKWRVRPDARMVLIASKIMKDASTRVFGYIKDIHIAAPPCPEHKLIIVESQQVKGIFRQFYDEKEGKWLRDDRACIINVPVKVDAKNAEYGANLLGKHPKDRLILAFDEAQELPSAMAGDKIFLNWYTNERLDIYAWGNPSPIDYHSPESHDLLFKLGADKLSLSSLRNKEKKAHLTTTWSWNDTQVLHLSMLDSPKDDADEVRYRVVDADGHERSRLSFLAGKVTVDTIAEKVSPTSDSWYSQVLGFPFIDTTGSTAATVLNGNMLKTTRSYPLNWRTPENARRWYMGVDPAINGHRDNASIVCGQVGLMVDGRMGIDMMNGRYCTHVKMKEGEDFTDTTIETMWSMSQELNIPINHIGIETHGVGEVLRYALARHVEEGKWSESVRRGGSFGIVSPVASVTDRWLFKTLGNVKPAKEMCADIITEYWVAIRCAVLTRQIFNIPDLILNQFYNRHLTTVGSTLRYKVETKPQMIKRGVKSPNDGDAICNMMEIIRRNGFPLKFYNRHSYDERYGPDYDASKEHEQFQDAMGVVSDLLNMGNNLSQYTGRDVKKKKRERKAICNIPAV